MGETAQAEGVPDGDLPREIERARARQQMVLDAIPAMIGYWNRELCNELSNASYARLFQRTPEQIRGSTQRELLGDEAFERTRPHVEAVLAGLPQHFHWVDPTPGGAERHYEVSYLPDERDGQVVGFCVLVSDVSASHATAAELARSEERYRALFEHMQTGFALHEIVTDEGGRPVDYVFLACNAAYTSMTGLREEAIVGRRVTQVLPGTENDPADWIGVFGAVAQSGRTIHLENYSEAIGRWYDVVAYRPGPGLFAVLIQDVTERRRIAAEMVAQHERLSVTLRSIGDGVITTDERGRIEYLNPVAERLTGWPLGEAAGRDLTEIYRIVDEATREPTPNPVAACLAGGAATPTDELPVREQRVLIARDGGEFAVADSAAAIRDNAGRVLGTVLVFHDISEQRELAREVSYRASHDALTGLFNRTEFDSLLQRELATAQQGGYVNALLYIDLDQFKIVNDACGHSVGDELLRQLAELLQRGVRTSDTLARLGGDEFGVILSRCDADSAQRIAQEMCEQIDGFRFTHEGRRFRIGASIGVVPLDRRWPNAAAVLQAADIACYAAKESGRNRVHVYADVEGLAQASQGLMRWATRLQEAIEEDRFALYCQRILPLRPQAGGAHFEILVRMIDEEGAIVLPGAFMPAAERYQLASRIDRWVLSKVLLWMRAHPEAVASIGILAVNLSGQSIGDRGFHRFAEEAMRESGVDGSRLCFEITETAAISNLEDANRFFKAMRVNGCRFALDDFGSGLSSFGYLKTLPVDYLKIDGQFVRNAHSDALDRATVRCIQEVACVVGKQTIAECVESEEVRELMRTMGVDFAQGYAVHRPEPIDAVLRAGGP